MKEDIQLKIQGAKDRQPVVARNNDETFNLTISKQSITNISRIELMKIRNVINSTLKETT